MNGLERKSPSDDELDLIAKVPSESDRRSGKRKHRVLRDDSESEEPVPPPRNKPLSKRSKTGAEPESQVGDLLSFPRNPLILTGGKSDRSTTSAGFQRHESFWFFDGSLFIQLGGVRFKLHRSRLNGTSIFLQKVFGIRDGFYEKTSLNISLKSGDSANVSVKVEEVDGFDLYILDGVGVNLEDFVVLMNLMENSFEYCDSDVSVFMLASAIRAATTLQCPTIRSWAIITIERIWNLHTFLEPLPNPSEVLNLARTHGMHETVITRALYELLRAENFDAEVLKLRLPTRRERLDSAKEQLYYEWISIAADPQPSTVRCPFGQRCTSHSPSEVQKTHMDLVHMSSLLERHLSDPIGGLEYLISLEDRWSAAGYCPRCVHLRTRLWADKKDEIIKEMKESNNWLLN
ncbi:BTB domain-containing protein [Mycena venus]|uniref:BTB domain-containing protein n=1 Tax=Mycena venus TaxID=2733690 RepID=A0A8H7D3A4_9AGAR|nr:BTB domain-containing protein [Mycena venus]